MRRVVITGMGLVTAGGNDLETNWSTILAAKSPISRITKFDPKDLSVQIAAEVKDLDPTHVIDAKEMNRTTEFIQYARVAADEALKGSGILDSTPDFDRFGTSIGAGIGALGEIEKNVHTLRDRGPRRVSPFFMPYTIPNMAAGIVSKHYGLRGPNICTATACTSGTHAVGEGWLYIQQNMADVMLCGGTEGAISPIGIAAFAAMKALSKCNDHPEISSRPFEKNRDGFVMGEGCGVLVLEEEEHAKKRGAKIYAEVVGYGMSADAHHITAPPPGGEGAQRCMRQALQTGKLNPQDVSYVNAHGTSTKLNDLYETQAIAAVFDDHAGQMAISSTKGITGHCLGAAGGIEAVISALAIDRGVVPPTANLHEPDPECFLNYTPLEPREMKIEAALSNSFGFGGTNGTIAMRRYS